MSRGDGKTPPVPRASWSLRPRPSDVDSAGPSTGRAVCGVRRVRCTFCELHPTTLQRDGAEERAVVLGEGRGPTAVSPVFGGS